MISPELVDYIELAKVLEHDLTLTNPMYSNLGLDEVICDICRIAWNMKEDDGRRVAFFLRAALPANHLTRIELMFMASQAIRSKALNEQVAKAFTEGGKWTRVK